MAKLIVNPTSSFKKEISLSHSLLSIGRDPSNDLVLPDAMVSRRHAVIEYRGSQYFLRDCNSSNGSLVNGDRVSERSLRDGDLVAIGTARLLFRDDLVLEDSGGKVVQHPSAPRQQCPSCQADYRKGDQFCRQCGAQVTPSMPAKAVCASCATVVPLPANYCNACGSPLAGERRLESTRPRPRLGEAEAPPSAGGAAAALSISPLKPAALAEDRRPEPEAAQERIEPLEAAPPPPLEIQPHDEPLEVLAPSSSPPARVAEAPGPPVPPPPPRIPAARRAADTPKVRPRPVLRAPRQDAFGEGMRPSRAGFQESEPAPLGGRLAAGLIDAVLVGAGQALLLAPAFSYWWSRDLPTSPSEVSFLAILLSLGLVPLAAALGAVYYIYFWGVRGDTPGKRLAGLQVEGVDGAFPIGTSRAALRLIGYVLSGLFLGIGFLMIAFGGSGLHDRIAGTRVVRRERS